MFSKLSVADAASVNGENPFETIALLALPVLLILLLFLRRHRLDQSRRGLLVAAKVELSVIKRSRELRFLGELAILVAIAFFVAEILTNTRFVRDDAFVWLLVGLPICFLLGRFWWRKYR